MGKYAADQRDEEMPMHTEPRSEHQWLRQFLGEWHYESRCTVEAGQPPVSLQGMESVSSLGDLWLLFEGRGEMPGGGLASTLRTLGYDPMRERFVGTWVGSMMTHLWTHEGSLDAERHRLILDTEGPSSSGDGALTRERDILEFKSADHRVLTVQRLEADGQWRPFMTVDYRRDSHTVALERIFDAPRERVFAAWTEPELMRQWSMPRGLSIDEGTGEFHSGGIWRGRMRSPDGKESGLGGVYGEIAPLSRLSFTHAWDREDGGPGTETRVTISLEPCRARTLFRFREEGFTSRDLRDFQASGWSECFGRLAELLALEPHHS